MGIKRKWTVDDVLKIEKKGPWSTKSGGNLDVLFSFDADFLFGQFLSYESVVEDDEPDICGLRSYVINDLESGREGGGEYHLSRHEIILALSGEVAFSLEDLCGRKRKINLNPTVGIYLPPTILHTYHVVEPSSLLVICNTTFDPEDKRTYDTYLQSEFRKLQEEMK